MNPRKYNFTQNDPLDKKAKIKLVIPPSMSSFEFMKSIKNETVNKNNIAIWYLGQNGFVIKEHSGKTICIDPYLSNYCGVSEKYQDSEFRLDRQLPIFIKPQDLDVDIILITHSHDDHADPSTLSNITEDTTFIGPWEAYQKFKSIGIDEKKCKLIHPNQSIDIFGLKVFGTFALPTDQTDLNHIGFVVKFSNGITFFNSGDTDFTDLLSFAGKFNPDVATICINGGFNNLDNMDAVKVTQMVQPKVVIPCHYDMMVNNIGNPLIFESFLRSSGSKSKFQLMAYYKPYIYEKSDE